MRQGNKRQYLGLVIERGRWGYYVFDWDIDGWEGETIAILKTLREAEMFIERRCLFGQ